MSSARTIEMLLNFPPNTNNNYFFNIVTFGENVRGRQGLQLAPLPRAGHNPVVEAHSVWCFHNLIRGIS
jgi:hypothetical protein